MFNVIIIGGDSIPTYEKFQSECIKFLRVKAESGEHIRILSIGDDFVNKFAVTFGIEVKTFNCDWLKYGKTSIYMRNKEIVSEANAIIYFDSNKKDLANLYDYATKCGLNHRRVEISELSL